MDPLRIGYSSQNSVGIFALLQPFEVKKILTRFQADPSGSGVSQERPQDEGVCMQAACPLDYSSQPAETLSAATCMKGGVLIRLVRLVSLK